MTLPSSPAAGSETGHSGYKAGPGSGPDLAVAKCAHASMDSVPRLRPLAILSTILLSALLGVCRTRQAQPTGTHAT
jgi:hypothetical protein